MNDTWRPENFQRHIFSSSGSNNSRIWKISFKGAEKTLYEGENFTLQFKFPEEYVKKKLT